MSNGSEAFSIARIVVFCKPDPKSSQPPLTRDFWEETKVQFADLEKEAIDAYVASGEPMGKAGAYGLQGTGGSFVERIHDCYFNVMGFPVHRFAMEVNGLIKAAYLKSEPVSQSI